MKIRRMLFVGNVIMYMFIRAGFSFTHLLLILLFEMNLKIKDMQVHYEDCVLLVSMGSKS